MENENFIPSCESRLAHIVLQKFDEYPGSVTHQEFNRLSAGWLSRDMLWLRSEHSQWILRRIVSVDMVGIISEYSVDQIAPQASGCNPTYSDQLYSIYNHCLEGGMKELRQNRRGRNGNLKNDPVTHPDLDALYFQLEATLPKDYLILPPDNQ